jgi:hypothetical protein
MRFVKQNRVIHIQITEGVLLPKGKIDQSSVRTRVVPKLDVRSPDLVQGQDYHKLSYEERTVDLDDLEGPENHVLTGVRLRKIGSHLNFEIRTTPFNFTTGLLIQPDLKSVWISNDNTDVDMSKPRYDDDILRFIQFKK